MQIIFRGLLIFLDDLLVYIFFDHSLVRLASWHWMKFAACDNFDNNYVEKEYCWTPLQKDNFWFHMYCNLTWKSAFEGRFYPQLLEISNSSKVCLRSYVWQQYIGISKLKYFVFQCRVRLWCFTVTILSSFKINQWCRGILNQNAHIWASYLINK